MLTFYCLITHSIPLIFSNISHCYPDIHTQRSHSISKAFCPSELVKLASAVFNLFIISIIHQASPTRSQGAISNQSPNPLHFYFLNTSHLCLICFTPIAITVIQETMFSPHGFVVFPFLVLSSYNLLSTGLSELF